MQGALFRARFSLTNALSHFSRSVLPFTLAGTSKAALWLSLSTLSFTALADSTNQLFADDVVNPECISGLASERATIERVTDGDTVVLTDQRRVRLIGINSAELNARRAKLKNAAQQATDQLKAWLPPGEPVVLHLGEEPFDRHGRVLAHVVRESDGLAVAHRMVQTGLALQSAVAPTTRCTNDFVKLENQAIDARLGLWKIRGLMSINAKMLNSRTQGFKLISGTVTGVNKQSSHTEVLVENQLRLKVRASLARQLALQSLMGQPVEVRGWISHKKNKPYLWLQHAANLSILDN